MEAPEEDPCASKMPAVHFRPGPLEGFALLAPVRPSKIVCVGRNYRDHATELGNEVPKEPLLFQKPPSALLAPGGTVVMPKLSKRVDYEGELGVVLGKRCRNMAPDEDARTYIRGYVLVNDVTARDIQKSDGQWTRGKGWDTFCPVGPIVSDEIHPCDGRRPVTVTTRLNGEVKQTGSTADFIFAIPELLRYISACMTLEPGDLIPTGTPAGVGPMAAGDVVEVEIPGLGVLRNTLAAEE
jgi:2-keto-4-pentenoate hydratase/2-oxohepta-3-ene-1,7-dioic acid hydratase in catechol pathway